MVFLKCASACNLNVVLTVLNIRIAGISKLETAPVLANRENTEGLTSQWGSMEGREEVKEMFFINLSLMQGFTHRLDRLS